MRYVGNSGTLKTDEDIVSEDADVLKSDAKKQQKDIDEKVDLGKVSDGEEN